MRISVALCVYNGSKYLAAQLASIADQRRAPDELVICDDGSTDDSPGLVERFAAEARFPVRAHRNDRNLRSTKNFEKAIGLCDGDIIVTADQDDAWYPGKLARIEAAFERSPGVGLVFSDADLVDDDGRPLGVRLWPSVKFDDARRRGVEGGDAFGVLLRRAAVTGATMAFRASLRGLVLPIPPAWVHDEWIALMTSAVAPLLPIAGPLMQYRRHANNQVGVGGVTVAERARGSLARPRDVFLARSDEFAEFRSCLAERLPGRADLLARVDGKIAHYRARGELPSSRVRRLPGVFRELIALRYTRYSGTTLSFARDLLAKG